MNTTQLQCCIDCDPILQDIILGVFAANQLPIILSKYPCGFIANTDIDTKPGQHWCAFYLDKPGTIEFFDSYGRDIGRNSVHFKRWSNQYGYKIITNNKQIQSDYSNLCGLYCLYYLRMRLQGESMNDIVNSFSTELLSNDQYLYDTMTNVYYLCKQNDCKYNQGCKSLLNMI